MSAFLLNSDAFMSLAWRAAGGEAGTTCNSSSRKLVYDRNAFENSAFGRLFHVLPTFFLNLLFSSGHLTWRDICSRERQGIQPLTNGAPFYPILAYARRYTRYKRVRDARHYLAV